jgi:hypothetical protein
VAISKGEQELLAYLNKLYDEGTKARDKWSKNWKHSIDVIRGKTWPDKRPKYKIDAVMNFLGQIVEKKTAMLTDSRPTFDIVSRKKGLDDVCAMLKKVNEGIDEERSWEQKLTEFVMLEQHFGMAYTNTCFDPSLDWGHGDIDIVVLDPRTCVFDPFVMRTYNLNNGEYFCLDTVRPTDYLKDRWKERADDIQADFGTSSQVKEDSVWAKLRQLFGGRGDSEPSVTSVIPRSFVRDYWVRDRKTEEKDGLKYPNWREVLVAGGCIVEDGGNRYLDGNLPFDAMEWDFNVDSAYGFNEVSKLEMPQVMFNKVMATIIENAILMGNGIWIGDQDALPETDWDKLSNEPGSYVRKRIGRELRREPAPSLPAYVPNVLMQILTGLEKLSSITEATEGRRPGQVTSGAAIESLQIAASTAIRLKARQIESLQQRIGQKRISRIFQYYTEDRMFNLLGDDGKFQQYVWERQKIRESLDKAGIKITQAFQDFRYKVVPTSSLAITRWQKGLIAMQLLQAGVLDGEEVLKTIEWPNWEDVYKRTNEKQQMGVEGPPRRPSKLSKQMLRGGGSGRGEMGMQQPQIGK